MKRDTAPGLTSDIGVLLFAAEELAQGRPVALVTIVGLDGPFSRPMGAQLAVAADRRFVGSISGGCLEKALTEECQLALQAGANRRVRYGRGSPYLDVRLPCGGGIDLFIDICPNEAALHRAIEAARQRQPFVMAFRQDTDNSALSVIDHHSAIKGDHFQRRFEPRLRLILAGRGWEIVAMSELAQTLDIEIIVASQEPATLDFCRPYADQLLTLTVPAHPPSLPLDSYSALACLFHEHEWEAPILLDALRSEAFYVGALGSRQTHARRVETLRELGAGSDDIARLKGPIGLFASRDPRSVALSALAEIMMLYGQRQPAP